MLNWFYLLKNLSRALELSKKKIEKDILVILDKIAFHPEGLRSVNILNQSLDSGWRKESKG